MTQELVMIITVWQYASSKYLPYTFFINWWEYYQGYKINTMQFLSPWVYQITNPKSVQMFMMHLYYIHSYISYELIPY